MAEAALEVRNITKRFPGVLANDHINLTLRKGKVLGLLGENGAGKSTLMNLIYGLYQPDEGEILVNGKAVTIHSPNDAIAQGIGMVHQHFQLVEVLTVTDNIMLGTESTQLIPPQFTANSAQTATIGGVVVAILAVIFILSLGVAEGVVSLVIFLGVLSLLTAIVGASTRYLDRAAARRRITEISQQYGLEVDPEAIIQDLPVGTQQRVEIVKALYRNADILILDEPTAVLTPQETEGLFAVMRTLLERGVSIIFISHKLKEVLEICDDIAVLRLGKMVGTADPQNSTEQSLASMMVGRDVLLNVAKKKVMREVIESTPPVLSIRNLVVKDDRDLIAVDNLSLDVYAGEIVGIAGVQGNGQTELVAALTGLRRAHKGHFFINGQDMTNASPRKVTEAGVSHVPEDRQKDGMVGAFPIMYNIVLNTYYKAPYANGLLVNDPAIEAEAADLVQKFDVRTPNIYVNIGTLSGGNQQKVIVARELSRPIRLLIVSQPTRGLDVGSIEYIHKQIVRIRDEGAAVLLVSSELDEVLGLADRIAVMFEGQVNSLMNIEDTDRRTTGMFMAGVADMFREVAAQGAHRS